MGRTAPTRVRHAVVALAASMALLLYLDRNVLAITLEDMQRDLQLDADAASWLLSAFFWSYALAQVPSGWLSDRFGARKALTAYIALWSIFTGLLGVAGSFVDVFLLRLGCGIAQAGAYPTSANLLSKWVPLTRRAWASAIVANGGRVGGVLAPVLTVYLMLLFETEYHRGWRAVLVAYGLIGVVVAAFFWRIVRDQPRDQPRCNADELALIEAGRAPQSAGVAATLPLGAILRSWSLWMSALSQFSTNFSWVFLITWMPRYLEEVHRTPKIGQGWMCSLPFLLGIAGMLSGGVLTDWLTHRLGLRWGRGLPMGATRFLAAAAFVACIWAGSPWEATAALCVVAIATDLGVPAIWAFMQDVGGKYVGSVLGWGNMWGNFGAAVSPLVLNQVIKHWGWDAMFLTCGFAFVISGLAGLLVDARVPICSPETETKPNG